jgi:hypothetical protein
MLQMASFLPDLRWLAFGQRAVVIAYIHWVMLGAISTGFLAALHQKGIFGQQILFATGVWFFVGGFILTECLLAVEEIFYPTPHHTSMLAICAAAMATGFLCMLLSAYIRPVQKG